MNKTIWPKEMVNKINRNQFNNHNIRPITCPHSNGNENKGLLSMLSSKNIEKEIKHEANGRAVGILVAKEEGYLECPFCGYKTEQVPKALHKESDFKPIEHGYPLGKVCNNTRPIKEINEIEYEQAKAIYLDTQANNANILGVDLNEYLSKHEPFCDIHRMPPSMGKITTSCLMQRILRGEPPLEFPPPKNGSMPWYALIEENRPHEAYIGFGVKELGNESLDTGNSGLEIIINHNPWKVIEANISARAFLEIEKNCWDKNDAGDFIRPKEWKKKAIEIANAAPEFIVEDKFYGKFRVWYELDGHVKSGHRYEFYKSNYEILDESFSDDLLGLNPCVTKVEREFKSEEVDIPILDELNKWLSKEAKESEKARNAMVEHKPEMDFDLVTGTCGGWLIQRV